jgi:hypothetical protein
MSVMGLVHGELASAETECDAPLSTDLDTPPLSDGSALLRSVAERQVRSSP